MIKKKRIELRCTGLEKAIIKKKAENSGLSISEFCRASALEQKINYKLTAEEIEVYQTLLSFHKNFMALSNYFRAKNPSLANETRALTLEIKKHLKKLQ